MMIGLLDEELKSKQIGYIHDNRHFVNIPLSYLNCQQFVPSKEKREINLIREEIEHNDFDANKFIIFAIKEVKLKYMTFYIYILKDIETNMGCGMFVKDKEVEYMHLKGYNFTDPYAKDRDWICDTMNDAINKTGRIKDILYK